MAIPSSLQGLIRVGYTNDSRGPIDCPGRIYNFESAFDNGNINFFSSTYNVSKVLAVASSRSIDEKGIHSDLSCNGQPHALLVAKFSNAVARAMLNNSATKAKINSEIQNIGNHELQSFLQANNYSNYIKIIELMALLHDTGRPSDGIDQWDHTNTTNVINNISVLLKNSGLSSSAQTVLLQQINIGIDNKDNPNGKHNPGNLPGFLFGAALGAGDGLHSGHAFHGGLWDAQSYNPEYSRLWHEAPEFRDEYKQIISEIRSIVPTPNQKMLQAVEEFIAEPITNPYRGDGPSIIRPDYAEWIAHKFQSLPPETFKFLSQAKDYSAPTTEGAGAGATSGAGQAVPIAASTAKQQADALSSALSQQNYNKIAWPTQFKFSEGYAHHKGGEQYSANINLEFDSQQEAERFSSFLAEPPFSIKSQTGTEKKPSLIQGKPSIVFNSENTRKFIDTMTRLNQQAWGSDLSNGRYAFVKSLDDGYSASRPGLYLDRISGNQVVLKKTSQDESDNSLIAATCLRQILGGQPVSVAGKDVTFKAPQVTADYLGMQSLEYMPGLNPKSQDDKKLQGLTSIDSIEQMAKFGAVFQFLNLGDNMAHNIRLKSDTEEFCIFDLDSAFHLGASTEYSTNGIYTDKVAQVGHAFNNHFFDLLAIRAGHDKYGHINHGSAAINSLKPDETWHDFFKGTLEGLNLVKSQLTPQFIASLPENTAKQNDIKQMLAKRSESLDQNIRLTEEILKGHHTQNLDININMPINNSLAGLNGGDIQKFIDTIKEKVAGVSNAKQKASSLAQALRQQDYSGIPWPCEFNFSEGYTHFNTTKNQYSANVNLKFITEQDAINFSEFISQPPFEIVSSTSNAAKLPFRDANGVYALVFNEQNSQDLIMGMRQLKISQYAHPGPSAPVYHSYTGASASEAAATAHMPSNEFNPNVQLIYKQTGAQNFDSVMIYENIDTSGKVPPGTKTGTLTNHTKVELTGNHKGNYSEIKFKYTNQSGVEQIETGWVGKKNIVKINPGLSMGA